MESRSCSLLLKGHEGNTIKGIFYDAPFDMKEMDAGITIDFAGVTLPAFHHHIFVDWLSGAEIDCKLLNVGTKNVIAFISDKGRELLKSMILKTKFNGYFCYDNAYME